MINIGSLVGTLEFVDNATPKLVALDQQLHRTFGVFAQFQESNRVLGIGLQQFGTHISRIGDRLSLMSAGMVAVGAASAKLSTDFQTNMTKIVNLTGIGVKGMDMMREAVLKMGPQVAQGPIALSDALYSIGSVGLAGAQALSVLEKSAKATAIGMGETKDVARAVSAAVINYGDQGMTAARATDILTVAVKEGGAEADTFARTLGRVIATGKSVGVSFEEITASVATFTRLGVRADEAVTALRGTMAFLMKPSAGAEKALKELGISIEFVRDKVKKDGLADALIDLVNRTKGNEDAMARIIPNVRALAGVLANAGSQADSYRQILDKVKNSTGALDDAFKVVSETAGFKFQQALSRLQVIGIQLGDVLLPALVTVAEAMMPLLDVLSKLISAFEYLPEPIQIATATFLAFALALGPILSIWGRIIEAGGLIVRVFTGLRAIFFGAAAATDVYTAATQRAFAAAVLARAAAEAAAAAKIPIVTETIIGATFDAAIITNMRIAAASMADLTLKTIQLQLETTKIAGLLAAAGPPLAKYNLGWAMARNSTGALAAQLLATNPVITVTTTLLGEAAVATRVWEVALDGTVVRLAPFYMGMATASDALKGITIQLGPSTLLLESHTGATVAAAGAMETFAVAIGTATGQLVGFFAALTAGARAMIAPAAGVAALTAEVGVATTALTIYQRTLLTTATEAYAPFVLQAGIAGQQMKQLTDGSRLANEALVPLTGELVRTEQAAARAGGQLLLTGQRVAEVGTIARLTYAAIGFLTTTLTGLGILVVGTFTTMVVGAAALTKELDKLKATMGLIPGIVKDVFSIFGSLATLVGQTLVDAFKAAAGAVVTLRDSAEKNFPVIFEAIRNVLLTEFAKLYQFAALVDALAQKLDDLTRRSITAESIIAEAEERRQAAIAGLSPLSKGTPMATARQKAELQELVTAYKELTTTVDKYGVQSNMSGEVISILVEKFQALKAAGLALPKEIEMFIKIHTIKVGDAGKEVDFGTDPVAAATKKLEEDTNKLRSRFAQVDLEIKGLSKGVREDLVYAMQRGGVSVKQMVEDYGHLFSSAEIAQLAIQQLGSQTQKAMQTARRETSWIENFRLETVQLEAQLKQAYAQGVPAAMIMDEFGNRLEHVANRSRMAKKDLGEFTAKAYDDFIKLEAQKPFEQMQKRATDLNAVIGAALKNGASIAQVYDIWGQAAVGVGEKSTLMGLEVGKNLQDLLAFANKLKLDEIFAQINAELADFQRDISRTATNTKELNELNNIGKKWVSTVEAEAKALREASASQEEVNRFRSDAIAKLNEMERAYGMNMKAIKDSQRAIEDYSRAFLPDTILTRLENVSISFKRQREDISLVEQAMENYGERMLNLSAEEVAARNNVIEAWIRSGAHTRAELEQFAVFAKLRYDFVRKSGLFAAEEIEKAWNEMVETNIKSLDQWTGAFIDLVASMPDEISKAFSKMMREAKTFKDFFTGIWRDIQNAIFNVFANIVQTFIRQVLQKLLASLVQSKSPFAQAFAGLIPGGIPGIGAPGGPAANFAPGQIPVVEGIPGPLPGEQVPVPGGPGTGPDMGALIGGGMMAVGGAVSWYQAKGSTLGNVMGGMQTGAGIGTMIMPGIGTAVGAGIGAIIGFIVSKFRTPEYKKIMNEVGQQLGVNISEGLAQEIEGVAKTIEGGTKRQRRELATLFSLDKIIEEGGGLTAGNVEKFEKQAMGLFAPIESGSKEAGKATEQLNDLIAVFADQAEKTGGLWDASFRAIITRAQELGLEMENLTAVIDAQVSKLGGGLDKLVSGWAGPILRAVDDIETFDDKLFKLTDKRDKLTAQIADMIRKGPSTAVQHHNLKIWQRDLELVNAEIAELQENQGKASATLDDLAANGQVAFDRLSRLALASFNTIMQNGKTAVEAMDAIGGAIDKLIQAHDKLGLQGNAAFDALSRYRGLITDNRDLVEAAGGLNDVMMTLSNLGGMTADIFADLQLEGKAVYDRLTAAGFTSNEALKIMAPSLETIVKLAKDHGFAIDENTQKLIDEARAQGLMSDEALDTNSILMTGFAAIIRALGGELPQAFKDFEEKARRSVQNVGDDLDDLEKPRRAVVRVDYEEGSGTRPPGDTTPRDETPPEEAPPVARGGIVGRGNVIAGYFGQGGMAYAQRGGMIGFTPKGTDTVPAMLTPGEMIITQQDQRNLMEMMREKTGGNDIDINAIVAAIVDAIKSQPRGDLQLVVNTPIGMASTIRQIVVEEIIPIWLSAVEDNRSGLRTKTKQALSLP